MYAEFFGLKREPFSIAPDPRYLFMSERHREALAHLLYGVGGGGGFVLLTGEIGAGKTTVCRCFLEQVPAECSVAYIFNPKLTVVELLQTVCQEFKVEVRARAEGRATIKDHIDALNDFLLANHAAGRSSVLIIDEAQNLSTPVLEQLRLLTNLETNERKLLQIVLIGQPELRDKLAHKELEQLAQRVVARYHLQPLAEAETARYIEHRMQVAGLKTRLPFEAKALRRVHRLTGGVPRRINLLCDRALLGAYGSRRDAVSAALVDAAAREVFGAEAPGQAAPAARAGRPWLAGLGVLATLGLVAGVGALAIHAVGPRSTAVAAAGRAASAPSAGAAGAAGATASAAGGASTPAVGSTAPAAAAPAAAPALAVAPWDDSQDAAQLKPRDGEAWRELARLWGEALQDGDACVAAARVNLQCHRTSIALAQVRQLDRPGIVFLKTGPLPGGWAVLAGLDATHATVRVGGALRRMTLAEFGLAWDGRFATLWRAPAGYDAAAAAAMNGATALWLAGQLDRALGPHPGAASAPPAPARPAALRERLAAFQRGQGLVADGRLGPVTFMQLNRANGVDEPRLAGSAAGPGAATRGG